MSKILCECGYVLSDSTDYISYKARFIADQDFYDFYDEVESECPHEAPTKTWRYFGDMFQCPDCGSLILFNADGTRRCDFKPINRENSENVALSFLGKQWKGHLYGHYYGESHPLEYKRNKGELYWQTNKESGHILDMGLEKLREKYFEKFNELKKLGILRGCFLRVDGNDEHSWNGK